MRYSVFLPVTLFVFFLAIVAYNQSKEENLTTSELQVSKKTKCLSRAQVLDRLRVLADSDPPEVKEKGFVYCGFGGSAIYTCPRCNQTAFYDFEFGSQDKIGMLVFHIELCRQIIKDIKNLNIELDESQFCPACSPDIKSPRLVLIVKYEDVEKPHQLEGVTFTDLQLIKEFLSESDKHVYESGAESPLKNYVKRLSELLGVEIELSEKESK